MAAPFGRITSALVLALLVAAPAVIAQNASNERIIRSWEDEVKLEDGTETTWTYTVTFNTDTGEYTRTIVDNSGLEIQRTVQTSSMISPSEEEISIARDIILSDSELGALYNEANNPVLSGGFVLLREEGHPCGPGSRCLQFDMMDVDEAAREVERIRYVIVDVRTNELVSSNFDPANNGNATRFNQDQRTDN